MMFEHKQDRGFLLFLILSYFLLILLYLYAIDILSFYLIIY